MGCSRGLVGGLFQEVGQVDWVLRGGFSFSEFFMVFFRFFSMVLERVFKRFLQGVFATVFFHGFSGFQVFLLAF